MKKRYLFIIGLMIATLIGCATVKKDYSRLAEDTGGTVTKGLIGKQDQSMWDGATSTFTRSTSAGYTLTLNKIDWPGVDILSVYGGGVNRTDATITAAMTAVGTSNKMRFFLSPGAWTITNNIAITSNIELYCPPGAILDGAGTLTISGPFEPGSYQVFGSSITVTGSPICEMTIPEWWGAVGDGATDDYAALDAALTHWLQRTIKGEFRFSSGKNYLCNTALSKTFTTNIIKGWSINGYGSVITSGLASGYLLTLTSDATVRYLSIRGLHLQGNGSEDGLLKLDGGNIAEPDYLYGMTLSDIYLEGSGGHGLFITGGTFETQLINVNSRTTNTTGTCILIDSGAVGNVSSIHMINCNTSGGEYGVRSVGATDAPRIFGGVFILAQKYGILFDTCYGTEIVNAHVENNWESAADLANGKAGIKINNFGTVSGVTGSTNTKQKYIVEFYVTANCTSIIRGGAGVGSTVKYAYINGAVGSSVEIIGHATYDILPGTTCTINRQQKYRKHTTISTSGTGEDDLHTYTVPADSMGALGSFRIFAAGTKEVGGGNKTLKLHWGGVSYTFHAAANNTNDWRLEAIISNYNETTQYISWMGHDGATVLQGYESGAIDTTAAAIIKITGECADAGDVIRQPFWVVERM